MECNSGKRVIVLIIPALTPGGAERVMSLLANNFSRKLDVIVHLILLVGGEIFYELTPNVRLHFPSFDYKRFSRVVYSFKLSFYLRNKLSEIKPDVILSFEGRYNSFVLFNSSRVDAKRFISERSSPIINQGIFIRFLNKIFYPKADGIISQTSFARKKILQKYPGVKVKVIGNPIKSVQLSAHQSAQRKNVILNVGRFISTKHQELLVEYFYQIDNKDWEVWFVGDGGRIDQVKERVVKLGLTDKVKFWGNQKDITRFYLQAKVFAFTSSSEGFPNALGEAMGAGCACISFDCVSGPSDLITNNFDGILIPLFDHISFKNKLNEIMCDDFKIKCLGERAIEKINLFYNEQLITDEYFEFLLENIHT
jgi:glycosyltransferase involved in cell wall biosynthesis